MADIKVKESKKDTIKTINKAIVGTQKIKNRVSEAKEKVRENTEKEENTSGITYAVNKVSNQIKNTPYTIKKLNQANNYGKENFTKTKENIKFAEQKIQYVQKRNHAQKVARNMIKGRNAIVNENAINTTEDIVKESRIKIKDTANPNTIKLAKGRNPNIVKTTETTSKKAIKTAENTSKNAIKTSKIVNKNAKRMAKASKRAMQTAKETAKKASKGIKVAIKATVSSVKAIIAGTKALISALIAGGWVVAIIVIVICLIAMLCSSIFGIFFSSENIGSSIIVDGVAQPITMNRVVNDLNKEFMNKITSIQLENPYDEYDITGGRANWKDVLAVYTVKLSGGDDKVEVMTLDNNKINTIREIFWTMNEVNFTKETETHEEVIEVWDKTGSKTVTKTVTYTKLHINITTKNAYEMARLYDFTPAQNRQLEELLKDEYSKMWSAVIYGSSGSNDIVAVALSQVGNVGGEPYWSWYGFPSRVEWCACFVSFCANECGYIESGLIPKFASCESEGVTWFKACGLWQDGGYTPKPGDIAFFDWKDKHDGHSDHVGIVEKVENGRVYTVEGNSNDSCKQRDYDLNSTEIQGYGTPMY